MLDSLCRKGKRADPTGLRRRICRARATALSGAAGCRRVSRCPTTLVVEFGVDVNQARRQRPRRRSTSGCSYCEVPGRMSTKTSGELCPARALGESILCAGPPASRSEQKRRFVPRGSPFRRSWVRSAQEAARKIRSHPQFSHFLRDSGRFRVAIFRKLTLIIRSAQSEGHVVFPETLQGG